MREVKIFWMTREYDNNPRGLATFYRFCYKRGDDFVVKSSRSLYGNKRRNLECLFRKSLVVSYSTYLPEDFSKDIFFVIWM